MAVRNRFQILLWKKQADIGREISLVEIAETISVSRQTLDKYKRNQMDFVNLEVVEKLCNYFECEVADFLYIDRSNKQSEAQQ